MPIKVEQLPGESIITATVSQPFEPRQDIPALFEELTRLRLAIQGEVALILDLSSARAAFSQTVIALAEASSGIKSGRAAGIDRPPIVIFVGTGILADLASKAMGQRQYGGVKGHLCATKDEALALAREVLAAKKEHKE
jgi:hypothetical protein